MRLQVVVNDHPPRSHDRHLTHLARLEPAALDRGKALVREDERHIGHVLDVRRDVGISLAVHRHRKLAENVQNDGDVVRREIPCDIDVLLKEAQVKAPRIDVANIANVTGLDDLRRSCGRQGNKEMCDRPSGPGPCESQCRSTPRIPPSSMPSAFRQGCACRRGGLP